MSIFVLDIKEFFTPMLHSFSNTRAEVSSSWYCFSDQGCTEVKQKSQPMNISIRSDILLIL